MGRGGKASLEVAPKGSALGDMRLNVLGSEQTTLAQLLVQAGYETAAFVGGPILKPVFGILQGYAFRDADLQEINGQPADVLTVKAMAWLQQVPPGQPLHLLVNYSDPMPPKEVSPGTEEQLRSLG